MKKHVKRLIARMAIGVGLIAAALPTAVTAQSDEGVIIVTGSRVDRSDYDRFYDEEQSAIGLTRKADYFVKPLYVSSDSRDEKLRKQELQSMLSDTVQRASGAGIQLVAGNYRLKPITQADIDDLPIRSGRRPDTSRVLIYARIPIGSSTSTKSADQTIEGFVKSVPVTGRSYIETGETVLAINNPDKYRGEVVRAIADESKRYAAMFGSDYGVEIRGLDSELFFKQASETEVFLYIEHNFVIKPK